MEKFLITYEIILRKTYRKWFKGRSNQVDSLLLFYLLIHLLTIILVLEWLTPLKGIVYLSYIKIMPIALVGGLIGAILYSILYYSFPPSKYNTNKII